MDDTKIVELYFARDEQAIGETSLKYGKLCHRIAQNILNDASLAEECVNDTYLGIWNAIPPARPTSFKAFVCKIARNLSIKRKEAETSQKRSAAGILPIDELAEVLADESIADGIEDEEIGRAIGAFLKTQKADVRHIFVRKYYFFDSLSDIAGELGFSESRVKNVLYHTRIKLKKYLIEKGIAL